MFRITGRLQEEREAAETRSQKLQERVLRFNLESRVNELNEKLAQTQKQLREQREAMEMEQDESRSQLSASEAKAHRLEGQLEMAHERLLSQGAAFQQLVRKLEAERDHGGTQLSEAEARAQKLQETLQQEKQEAKARGQDLATLRQTLWQEKKAAEVLVHQLKAEQDERRTQLSGFESHLQNLEEKLALAQRQFQNQRETVTRMIQQRAAAKD